MGSTKPKAAQVGDPDQPAGSATTADELRQKIEREIRDGATKQVNVRLPPSLAARLKSHSTFTGEKIGDIMRDALERYFAEVDG